MSNPYDSVAVGAAYNASPPSNDASETSNNQLDWDKHKDKLSDPLKTALESINSNNSTAHGLHFGSTFESKAIDYQVAAPGDRGKFFSVTGTTTITLPAVGDAGVSFPLLVVNNGAAIVSVVGVASELINNDVTITLRPNDALIVTCDGSAWTGAVIAGSDSGSFTPTFTGFSSDPATPTVYWTRSGNIVTAVLDFASGTSNDTNFGITNIPAAIQPMRKQVLQLNPAEDNGGVVADGARLTINASSAWDFDKGVSAGIWTSSSTKGFNVTGVTFSYLLN